MAKKSNTPEHVNLAGVISTQKEAWFLQAASSCRGAVWAPRREAGRARPALDLEPEVGVSRAGREHGEHAEWRADGRPPARRAGEHAGPRGRLFTSRSRALDNSALQTCWARSPVWGQTA